jgi:hypothetical protein
MSTIWLRDFKGGLDARRMPEALPGGFALKALDGHFTRGGEFEQRAAFVLEYTLPASATTGLAVGATGLYAFGHAAAPTMPKGVTYQRLQHPDGSTALHRVLSSELHTGKLYVVAEFVDGSIQHFYDGSRVTDWQDGRARASFTVTTGGIQAAVAATGTLNVSGGSAGVGNNFTVSINGVALHIGSVAHTGNNTTTAAAIAAAINAATTSPDYTASNLGAQVTIASVALDTSANGLAINVAVAGDATVSSTGTMSGGQVAQPSQLTDLTVNGVSIIETAVSWRTSHAATAEAIADAINSYSSVPDYTATAVGARVNILAATSGTTANGYAVTPTLALGMVVDPASGIVMASGAALSSTYQAGTFAKTIGSKVYVTAGPNLQFSGVSAPSGFATSHTGAGFTDLSTQAAGSERLRAIGKYLQNIAVFAGSVIQIWYVDPDPSANKQVQVLYNMGTDSARSVTQFGDNDLFFLNESGVRSLRARDASNSAATNDVGIPVDPLITVKLQQLSDIRRARVIGLIEPRDGRFWLVFEDEIFVLSLFTGSGISAWSTYTPAVSGVSFTVDDAQVFGKRVYLRSGDKVYSFGGRTAALQYDNTEPELWTPYLDGDKPAVEKQFRGIDVACEGEWVVSAALDPTNLDAYEKVATIDKTTYFEPRIGYPVRSSHISLRFKGGAAGAKRIAAAAAHYDALDKGE